MERIKLILITSFLFILLVSIVEALRGNDPAVNQKADRATQPASLVFSFVQNLFGIFLWLYRIVAGSLSTFLLFVWNVIASIFAFITSFITSSVVTTTTTTTTTAATTTPATTAPVISTTAATTVTPTQMMSINATSTGTVAASSSMPQNTAAVTTMTVSTSSTATASSSTSPTTSTSATTAATTTTTTSIPATITTMQPTKVVFVSSSLHGGNFGGNPGGITSADDICNMLASTAGFNTTFMSWLSNSSTSPSDRFVQSTVPYVLTNGDTLALSYSLLVAAGTPLVAPNVDEMMNTAVGGGVWTGTNGQGAMEGGNCDNWFTGMGGGGQFGDFSSTSFWVNDANGAVCETSNRIYCFEQ